MFLLLLQKGAGRTPAVRLALVHISSLLLGCAPAAAPPQGRAKPALHSAYAWNLRRISAGDAVQGPGLDQAETWSPHFFVNKTLKSANFDKRFADFFFPVRSSGSVVCL